MYRELAGRPRRVNGWKRPTGPSRAAPLEVPDIVIPPAGGIDEAMIPHAQDQGQIGDCVAQTGREVMTGLALRQGRGEELFSALYLYFRGRELEGVPPTVDSGLMVATVFEVLEARGVPFKASWDDDKPYAAEPPPPVDDEAAEHKALVSVSLPNLFTMKASLSLGFAFGFGFDVPAQMMSDAAASSGLVEFPADPSSSAAWDGGGHAVSVWRWDDRIKIGSSVGAFDCLNHWSAQWGRAGRFWLPYDFVLRGHADDAHTLRRAGV